MAGPSRDATSSGAEPVPTVSVAVDGESLEFPVGLDAPDDGLAVAGHPDVVANAALPLDRKERSVVDDLEPDATLHRFGR